MQPLAWRLSGAGSFARYSTDALQQEHYHPRELSHIFQNRPFSFRA